MARLALEQHYALTTCRGGENPSFIHALAISDTDRSELKFSLRRHFLHSEEVVLV